jgi:DNA repair exonuclease SbcCD nuclease subunit
MRLVHLSDLHLGYRQYQRLTPGGINQREADVAATFRTAVDRIIALRPDAIVVAGDVFHTVRPTNQAILHAFLQFNRLRQALADAAIVVVAGNHDTPRLAETGGILQLFAQLGLDVVDREARRLSFPNLDLSVLAVPGGPGVEKPSLTCDDSFRYNVLVVHGRVPGAIPELPGYDVASTEYTKSELSSAPWDYVALGDYHVHQEVGKNAFYSGSIEYTSLNPWRDLDEERNGGVKGKGFVERNLATGEHTFHPVPCARKLLDLAPIQARGITPAEIDARIRATVDGVKGGIDDQVVRLIVRDVSRQAARELDHKAIRDYKRRALNFHLDLRRPEQFRSTSSSGAPGRRVELKEIVAEKLRVRPLDADVNREVLVARAVSYIDEAQAAAVAAPSLFAEA